MKRGRSAVWLLLAFLPVTIAVILVFGGGEREPAYKGKRLSQWLNQYEKRPHPGMPMSLRSRWASQYQIGLTFPVRPPRLVEAEGAVRHIGKESLPWLVRWLGYEPPAWRQKLSNVMGGWRMPLKEPIMRLVR